MPEDPSALVRSPTLGEAEVSSSPSLCSVTAETPYCSGKSIPILANTEAPVANSFWTLFQIISSCKPENPPAGSVLGSPTVIPLSFSHTYYLQTFLRPADTQTITTATHNQLGEILLTVGGPGSFCGPFLLPAFAARVQCPTSFIWFSPLDVVSVLL